MTAEWVRVEPLLQNKLVIWTFISKMEDLDSASFTTWGNWGLQSLHLKRVSKPQPQGKDEVNQTLPWNYCTWEEWQAESSARSVESVLSYCPQCVCTDTLQLIFNISTCTYIYKCYLATYLINVHFLCMCMMS